MSRTISYIVIILSVMMLMASCSTTRRGVPVAVSDTPGHAAAVQPSVPDGRDLLHPRSKALVSEARSWLGTPYKYGGEDHSGVDCSGLVMQVYKNVLDIKMPRSSGEQRDFCSLTAVASLIPGDLLFYATGKDKERVSHVGIYIGGGKMIHASASRGVVESDISEQYFVNRFAGAGFVDRYHAMLKPSKPTKPSKPERTAPRPVDVGVELASTPQPAVEEKTPERTQPEPEAAQVAVAATTALAVTTPITSTVETTASQPTAEPSVEDARNAVLGSIIERKLK
ncbi:MAG: C40 family peptidase [Muribaculaceae bacterium]|nr:C40 family peptidase [Muribaculaceae bacterium]